MVVNYDVPITGADEGFKPDLETYIHRIGQLPEDNPSRQHN
jgi:superfamily II DNA/RNA helicase